ncbi:uncharacterized protein LOC115625411 [Scaptodrosophila lebanonensis]|uniref:Uncharacterized protein LOC115625411 n=1 Tax=Drosophila lebanonensis TaxID=7225 RepID=A0A6J2TI08_DROLE|nr:uncharacterized protein LOC115625411 [Scaptodrosophila lebanonensis]
MSGLLTWGLLLLILHQTQSSVVSKSENLDATASLKMQASFIDHNNVTLAAIAEAQPTNPQRRLSRGKRFVAFPEGSSASAAICLTTGVLGNPNLLYLSFGLNWGVAYDLPNVTWVLHHLHGFRSKKAGVIQIKRRHRRDLYGQLEAMMGSMGYDGRDCILRTLCESRQYFQRTKMSMIGEMLRAIFSLPKQRLYSRELRENSDIVHYDRAYRNALDDDCNRQYNCPFSLLELAFGKYSTPPKNYYA